jgi:hypothetical protein
MSDIRQIARQAAYRTLDAWNDLPYDARRLVSLTEFQADAVAVAVLREVEGALRRHSEWSNSEDSFAQAHSQGYRDAADYIANRLALLAVEPVEPERTGFYGGLGGMCQHCGVAFDKHPTFCERCGKDIGDGFICVLWKGHTVACCGQRPSAVEPEPTDIEALRYDIERLRDELRIESATKAALQSQLNTLKEAYRHATS